MNTELVSAALEGQPIADNPVSLEEELVSEYLTPKRVVSRKWLNKLHPEKHFDALDLAPKLAEMPEFDERVLVHFDRVGIDGHVEKLSLRPISLEELKSSTSLSMMREMGAKKDSVRGRSGRMPFTPSGIDISEWSTIRATHRSHLGLLDIAPGLSRAGRFSESKIKTVEDARNTVPNIEDGADEEIEEDFIVDEDDDSEEEQPLPESQYNSVDSLLPTMAGFMRELNLEELRKPEDRDWAHMVDINQKFDNFNELVPTPARTWPFELDNFQKEAVYHLERGESVFIAAHTSAGKTVVAEYAMSLAAKHLTKCIYTSPIKALSNQKYRDFKKEYDDVGILTGDVQLNPEASTLIMTTEILRSMLYRGADIIRDVEFIIFDEVHYVNDSERGVVWEEVIIMLPDHVKLVLLSATVPNTFEFANWVGRTKQKDVYVISTPKRPVPLKHHLWVKKKLIEVVGDERKFNDQNYRQAQDVLKPPPPSGGQQTRGGSSSGSRGGSAGGRGGAAARGGARGGVRGGARGGSSAQQAMKRAVPSQPGRFNDGQASKTNLLDLTEFLRTKKLLPAVFFVFSRKLCEQYAQQLQSVSLNSGREKSQVYMFMEKATMRLRKEDRELPQIEMLRDLLQQGIGVHHSGLLPIMKEVVEILFAKGLVKLLFATETFAMGLNLPTRTVVFTAVKKFDSKTMRFLSPGEYTQMAGRAGRRGLDDVGTVIIMNNNKEELIPRGPLETLLLGVPTKLTSQFRLTYTMILSLLRIEALKVKDVIQQSFSENATHVLRPEREKQLIAAEKAAIDLKAEAEKVVKSENLSPESVAVMSTYHSLAAEYHELTSLIYEAAIMFRPSSIIERFCVYRSKTGNLMLGLVKNIQRSDNQLVVYVVGPLNGSRKDFWHWTALDSRQSLLLPAPTGKTMISLVSFEKLELISSVRVKGWSKIASTKMSSEDAERPYKAYYEDTAAALTEMNFDKLKALDARSALKKREGVLLKMREAAAAMDEVLGVRENKKGVIGQAKLYDIVSKIYVGERESAQIKASATTANTALLPDYEQRVDVLKEAHYVDDQLNVMLKGRVACEISTGYELYLTELLLDNFLSTFEPEEIVALLSVFVFEGARGAEDPPTVTPKLDEGKQRLLDIVEHVQEIATRHQVTITQDEAEFAEKNRFALMHVVYEWARGMNFSEIMTLTDVQEGLIVRVINRLDEVCRAVMSAARIIGDVDLYEKVGIAQERIKRDIVFCSSLYL